MEYLGVLAFVIVLCYMSYPDKVKKLERKVKKLEKERCRESIMSKLIEELVGRDCKISSEKGINFVGKTEFECHVMDCDEEWLKISLKDKKNQEIVKMKSIPDQSIDLYGQSSKEDIVQIKNPAAAMELQIGQAVLRISNQTYPRLLEQTLKLIGAFSFCGKSKKDDLTVFELWDRYFYREISEKETKEK